jgi:hypothetical protein
MSNPEINRTVSLILTRKFEFFKIEKHAARHRP